MERPKTRYARSGELSIAYQVVGDGPMDLVHIPGLVSHIDAACSRSHRTIRGVTTTKRSR